MVFDGVERGRHRPRRPAAAQPERAGGQRADHAVRHEAVRALVGLDRAARLRPEHAVGGDAEQPLGGGHGRAAAALLEQRHGGRGGRAGRLGLGDLGDGRRERRRHQRGGDAGARALAEARPGGRGGRAAPLRAGQRAVPMLRRAEVADARRLGEDRPGVVQEVGGRRAVRPGGGVRPPGERSRAYGGAHAVLVLLYPAFGLRGELTGSRSALRHEHVAIRPWAGSAGPMVPPLPPPRRRRNSAGGMTPDGPDGCGAGGDQPAGRRHSITSSTSSRPNRASASGPKASRGRWRATSRPASLSRSAMSGA